MSLKNFIFSKLFLKHLGYAIAIAIGILLILLLWLNIYTRHGQARPVPDFKGMSIPEAEQQAKKSRLQYQIIDSVYTNIVDKGCVVEQNPGAGFKVKKHRTISLIVNAIQPEMTSMPDMVDLPLRQAVALLENTGLEVGALIYRPDLSIDIVLNQQFRGEDIIPGSTVEKGSAIDLVLGKGLSNISTAVPNLMGYSFERAKNRIIEASLNLGTYIFDGTVVNGEDSTNAFVYQQNPEYSENATLQLGSSIYLWLTTDSLKLPVDSTLFVITGNIEESPEPNFTIEL